jgi:hypothetical protein
MVEAIESIVLDGVIGKRLAFCYCCRLLIATEPIGILPNGLYPCCFVFGLGVGHMTIRVGAVG